MKIYTVYHNPSDYPGMYVVRLSKVYQHGTFMAETPSAVSESLDVARQCIPEGYVRIARHADDDPCILEVWI